MIKPSRFRALSLGDDFGSLGDDSVLSGLENLFDAAIVFAVALLVALAAYWKNPLLLENQDFTAVVNPGSVDMELIVKEGQKLTRYRASGDSGDGEGELLGRAYRLPDGSVVYVPAAKDVADHTAESTEE
ncbi:MAG: DUF2149 domain-containing protein [Planctomycetia bacterium]|nr:DUF2149 domain-containing protein [Planctomycetia bacterium]